MCQPGEVRVGSRSDLHLLAEDDLSAARRCRLEEQLRNSIRLNYSANL
jgi:hypothetical protein